jgi:hypothetical protein
MDQPTVSAKSENFDVNSSTIVSTAPRAPSIGSWNVRNAITTTSKTGDVLENR